MYVFRLKALVGKNMHTHGCMCVCVCVCVHTHVCLCMCSRKCKHEKKFYCYTFSASTEIYELHSVKGMDSQLFLYGQ
jgi:hypothetical protein